MASDVVIVAIVAAVPVTVTAIAGLVVSLKNGRKADLAAVKQQEIHVLVNSNLTQVKNDLEDAKNEIATLKSLVQDLSMRKYPVKPH